jgi:hypothetical protein
MAKRKQYSAEFKAKVALATNNEHKVDGVPSAHLPDRTVENALCTYYSL